MTSGRPTSWSTPSPTWISGDSSASRAGGASIPWTAACKRYRDICGSAQQAGDVPRGCHGSPIRLPSTEGPSSSKGLRNQAKGCASAWATGWPCWKRRRCSWSSTRTSMRTRDSCTSTARGSSMRTLFTRRAPQHLDRQGLRHQVMFGSDSPLRADWRAHWAGWDSGGHGRTDPSADASRLPQWLGAVSTHGVRRKLRSSRASTTSTCCGRPRGAASKTAW